MAKEKLTGWFPASVKPARPGVYLATICKREEYYRRWDGESWYTGGPTPQFAENECIKVHYDNLHWRGLAHPPKGA
jgi:hypothetical protein